MQCFWGPMKLRVHKTNWKLWCAMSALVFLAIGLIVHFNIKGNNASLLRWTAESIQFVFSDTGSHIANSERLGYLLFVAANIVVWGFVAAVIGWFLQCVVV